MAQFQQGSSGNQQQQGYMSGPFVPDYNAPAYGMRGMPAAVAMPYVPYGLPAAPVPAYHAAGLPPADGWQGGEQESVAHLAQGIESNLVLNPQQQMMGAPGQGQYYGGPQQRGPPPGAYGYGYAPPAPGLRGQQQPAMHQQHMAPQGMAGHPHQMLNGNGPYGHPAGGPGNHHQGGGMGPRDGGRGRGPGRGGPLQDNRQGPAQQGQQGPGQQQRRKKVQRGLEDNVKRTVYISYIDQQVTEESLATFFADCGTVMDCRICGDPNSAMRFAFIEFLEEAGAQEALNKTGCTLGTSQLRVLPSKTAIVPVNKELMPRSHEELERCSRTVYVANIDKKVEREDVRNFFEQLCGKVNKIRLLGDLAHSTRIAFIEFIQAEAAMAALNCSGALLGSLPLRVSPSKTPVRGEKEDKEARGGRQQRPGSANRQAGAVGTAAANAVAAAAQEGGKAADAAAAAAAGDAGLAQENGTAPAAAAAAAAEGASAEQPAEGQSCG
ncbi:hypothetical protein OEZ85_003606 [Tetradesmus obliquus]|uniref:RRM domain-containing protein n=1 Tax=Tetradesmus obliquus TaxID=3088 RepID=A0ABY8UBV9_TETOB|nr:hypothetical protein OEZ85_003606 [Tetradesmus obliquus]